MKKILFLSFLLVILSSPCLAGYNPLRLQARAEIPKEITTVGQAVNYFAEMIEYKLVIGYPGPAESPIIARQAIGPLARVEGIKRLDQVLLLLIGGKNQLIVDHEHKLLSFERIPAE